MRHNRTDAHMNLQDCHGRLKICTSSNQMSCYTDTGKWTCSHLYLRSYYNWYLLDKETQFSPMYSPGQPPKFRSIWPTQNILCYLSRLISFYFCRFCLIDLILTLTLTLFWFPFLCFCSVCVCAFLSVLVWFVLRRERKWRT